MSKYFPLIRQRRWNGILGAILTSSLLVAANGSAALTPSAHVHPTTVHLTSLQMETATVGWATDWHLASPKALFGGQILHTVDGGRQWINVTPPHVTFNEQPGPLILPHDTVTDFVSPATAWAATDTAVSYPSGSGTILLSVTHDSGSRWQQWTVHLPNLADRALFNPILNQVDFVNAHVGWMVFDPLIPPGGAMAGSFGMEVWRTTNGGHTWARVYQTAHGIGWPTFDNATSGWMFLESSNRNLLPLGGVDTLERTLNGGHTWTAVSVTLIAGLNLAELPPIFDGTHGVLLTRLFPGIFAILRTTNGGQHWGDLTTTPISVPSNWTGQQIADLVSNQVFWILTPTKLWRSTTGGQRWTLQSTATLLGSGAQKGILKNIDFLNQQVGWLWGNGPTVWMTTDGGRRWTSWVPVLTD
ncbi:MAG: hypothetical protein M1600_05840 [Firmicutes bacterium]|nr:hypothetical protein [Bacillota bacterium]